ncbi:succinate dehydrogenase cytochrome b subunit [Streptomyces sp. GSL17-111]|uniref:succinate dehydrogenase cytochrome b subunit n=1 Tax=Streptomyces sp. GSL17-111 TaxID=3121596 RepID=UPI0030F3A381
MAPATRTDTRPSTVTLIWRTTVGKKAVMAVTGVAMLLYLVVHMLGNLKIFFGPGDFNGYAHWLRTIGEPFLRYEWFLWFARAGLLASVVLHGLAAYQLTRLDRAARPVAYVHRDARRDYATRTMRWGGVILALFVVWHILDLTTGTVNPRGEAGNPYGNVVATFSTWYGNTIYCVAMLAVGLHVRHGLLSAGRTLGAVGRRSQHAVRVASETLALTLTAGFLAVPLAVMTGVVN